MLLSCVPLLLSHSFLRDTALRLKDCPDCGNKNYTCDCEPWILMYQATSTHEDRSSQVVTDAFECVLSLDVAVVGDRVWGRSRRGHGPRNNPHPKHTHTHTHTQPPITTHAHTWPHKHTNSSTHNHPCTRPTTQTHSLNHP